MKSIAHKPKKRVHVHRNRSGKAYNKRKGLQSESTNMMRPRAHREAVPLLEDIGRPEPAVFVPDPFQTESVDRIAREDVLVSAPTGSGKTWIAVKATELYLARGLRIWYATPLKALSNSKYKEFCDEFGPDRVGILTGDRKENPDAPVIVGTTEILRNQLYDAMEAGEDMDVDLVILDEAHYLGDPDRGVVWEEVLIYLPHRVRLLLLSATVSNARELAEWLQHIRSTTCSVVKSKDRPVPLNVIFMTPSGEVTPFFSGKRLFHKVANTEQPAKNRRRGRDPRDTDIEGIVNTMRELKLLPAIVFLTSRADCDKAVRKLGPSPLADSEDGFNRAVFEMCEDHPELMNHKQLDLMLQTRAGSHHAGQLPAWRLLIETMMTRGFLEVIFSTSTVAAGVNFPARTVAVLQSDRYDGRGFVDMTATELHQMTGRAGRRGMDKAGFTLIVPGRHMDVHLVRKLIASEPEPLQSRITVNFSMALNLLMSHDPHGVTNLLGNSFAAFHPNPKRAQRARQKLQKTFKRHVNVLVELDYLDETGVPTYDGRWASRLRLDHPLFIAEIIRSGRFDGLSPIDLASFVAPFATDKEREVPITNAWWKSARKLWKRFRSIVRELEPLAALLIARGFDVPGFMFWPVAAVNLWAQECEWEELAENIGADEGDLAMLILRTADHLRQLGSLGDEKPGPANAAREALELLMRPPLV